MPTACNHTARRTFRYVDIFLETTFEMFSHFGTFHSLCAADGVIFVSVLHSTPSMFAGMRAEREKNKSSLTDSSESSSACWVSALWYSSCFQRWTHSRGWCYPDPWTGLLTGWQLPLPAQTCNPLSECNEIIFNTSWSGGSAFPQVRDTDRWPEC